MTSLESIALVVDRSKLDHCRGLPAFRPVSGDRHVLSSRLTCATLRTIRRPLALFFAELIPGRNRIAGGRLGASAGLVTAYATGRRTIIAESTNSIPTTRQFRRRRHNSTVRLLSQPERRPPTAGSCHVREPALALVLSRRITSTRRGLNTTNWLDHRCLGDGTRDVIHCGPGGQRMATLAARSAPRPIPLNATVTLTAPRKPASLRGMVYSCTPIAATSIATRAQQLHD